MMRPWAAAARSSASVRWERPSSWSALGAPVKLVFMTDGASSHAPRFIARDELAHIREAEGLAAARALGLHDADVTFLRHRDGKLHADKERAEASVWSVLERERPTQVFAPYHRDRLSDHEATYSIVASALDRHPDLVSLCGFPIWFWNHWPWMRPRAGARDSLAERVRSGLAGALWSTRELRVRVSVAAQLPAKTRALAEHRSQMTRLSGDREWPILEDVAQGDFLACLLRSHEYFHRELRGGQVLC